MKHIVAIVISSHTIATSSIKVYVCTVVGLYPVESMQIYNEIS